MMAEALLHAPVNVHSPVCAGVMGLLYGTGTSGGGTQTNIGPGSTVMTCSTATLHRQMLATMHHDNTRTYVIPQASVIMNVRVILPPAGQPIAVAFVPSAVASDSVTT